MTTKTLTFDFSYQRLARIMIAGIILLIGLYTYCVAAIVWGAADREKVLNQSNELASNVSTLEAQYVNLSGKVTLNSVYSLGFVEIGDRTGLALARQNLADNN